MAEVNQLRAQGQRLNQALEAVGLSKSSYYYQPKARSPKPLDENLLAALQQLEQTREDVYGYRKKTAYLRRQGLQVNPKKVYRHLKAQGKLQPRKRKGYHPTTLPYLPPSASNQRWEIDLTVVPCGIDGNGYGFPLMDCYDKEIIAEAFCRRCRAQEAEQVILEAVCRRFPDGQVPKDLSLTLRVDRGGQFIASRIRKLAIFLGLHLEVCGVQTPNDKPYIESFISCYKTEEVYRNQYLNFDQGHAAWKDYIRWYNRQRLHGALDYRPPSEVAPAPIVKHPSLIKSINCLAPCQAKSSTITTPF